MVIYEKKEIYSPCFYHLVIFSKLLKATKIVTNKSIKGVMILVFSKGIDVHNWIIHSNQTFVCVINLRLWLFSLRYIVNSSFMFEAKSDTYW